MIERADAFDVDTHLMSFAYGEDSPVARVAEAEVHGRTIGKPRLAERVLNEDQRTWIEPQMPAEKRA